MKRDAVATLQLLCRLREAEVDGARGRLALARVQAKDRETAERNAHKTHVNLSEIAESYMARQIEGMGPITDGASVYAALAFGALQRRREAASAELQHRRAESRLAEAEAEAETAAERYLATHARAEALRARRTEIARIEARRAARREDDAIAEALIASSVVVRGS